MDSDLIDQINTQVSRFIDREMADAPDSECDYEGCVKDHYRKKIHKKAEQYRIDLLEHTIRVLERTKKSRLESEDDDS